MATRAEGICDPKFRGVREAFEDNFDTRGEVGASVALTIDGKSVVDLWGGYADKKKTRPWTRDALVNVYSTTKGLTAVCAHRLVDEGKLDLDAPVAKYWPEFAQAGKEKLPVRYLLSHRAGLPAVRKPLRGDRPLQLGHDVLGLRGAGAVVGAGHEARLPCAELRLPGQGGDPADQRLVSRHLFPR